MIITESPHSHVECEGMYKGIPKFSDAMYYAKISMITLSGKDKSHSNTFNI